MFIYKQYTSTTLDIQYNNRLNAPDHEYHLEQWAVLSREAERKNKLFSNIRYGTLEREVLDIFPSDKAGSKTLIFIHGGYWYKHSPADFYFIVEAFKSYGITIVFIGYPLMPEYPMDQLIHSCRSAICWLTKNIHTYQGDPQQLFVAGHSAGGHLATMMMATHWPNVEASLAIDTLKGGCAISGLFNLLPVQLCFVNEILKMDKATALRNSPVFLHPQLTSILSIVVGGEETSEYLSQSNDIVESWIKTNENIQFLEIEGLNHFSILTSIVNDQSTLHRSICLMMGIS